MSLSKSPLQAEASALMPVSTQTHELIQIAAAAAGSGAQITFLGLSMRPTQELVQISTAGKGSVIFESLIF